LKQWASNSERKRERKATLSIMGALPYCSPRGGGKGRKGRGHLGPYHRSGRGEGGGKGGGLFVTAPQEGRGRIPPSAAAFLLFPLKRPSFLFFSSKGKKGKKIRRTYPVVYLRGLFFFSSLPLFKGDRKKGKKREKRRK